MRKAGAAEHFRTVCGLKRTEAVVTQQNAVPAPLPEARLTVLRQHSRAHLFAQLTGQGSVARDGVLVQNDLPVLAAGIRAFARPDRKTCLHNQIAHTS